MSEEKLMKVSEVKAFISKYKKEITFSVGVGTRTELIEMALAELKLMKMNAWGIKEVNDFSKWLNERKKVLDTSTELRFSEDLNKFENYLQSTYSVKDFKKLNREIKKYRAILRERILLIQNPINQAICHARYEGFISFSRNLYTFAKQYDSGISLDSFKKPIWFIRGNYPRLQHLELMDKGYKVQKARLIDLCDSRGLSEDNTDEFLSEFKTWYSNYRKFTKYRDSLE